MKARGRVLLAAGIAVVAGLAASGGVLAYQRWQIGRLEAAAADLTAGYVPLRFMVLARGDDTIAARFRFYAPDGREIAVFERSWTGYELAVDSWIVRFGALSLAFPAKVFTDAIAPQRGTELFGYYDDGGFPAIFDRPLLSASERAALVRLFARLRALDGSAAAAQALPGLYGNAVHEVSRLRSFAVGEVYALVARTSGGLEIVRE